MKTRILLAKDDSKFRSVFDRLLPGNGDVVLGAAHGTEARRILAEKPVDLLITDLIMPEKEGSETILTWGWVRLGLPSLARSVGGLRSACNYLRFARSAGAPAAV